MQMLETETRVKNGLMQATNKTIDEMSVVEDGEGNRESPDLLEAALNTK